MSKIPSLAFLIVGVVLLIFGINASDSVSSSVTEAVTGAPANKTIWLIALGIIGIIAGGAGLVMRRRS
ncbi:DUF3185 family protein [Horticoccus sp. 23ND18S-11]|uniref:DUF3185 family protein n=1 Tax=Horticoccus sp. 23ND18S-11 TaxID=3391832 RepID=UPI0039C8DA88